MNYQTTAPTYACVDGPVNPREITPCDDALSAVELETEMLIAKIQSLRSKLESVLRPEPESGKCGHARESGQSPVHERLLRQQSEIEGARRLLERIESLLTV